MLKCYKKYVIAKCHFYGFMAETFVNKSEGIKAFIQHVPAVLNKSKILFHEPQ